MTDARLNFQTAYRLRRLVACVPVDACASLAVWAADCAYADRRAGDPLACPLSRRRTTASLTCAAARELFSFNRIRDQWRRRDLGLPWTQYSGERPAAAPLGFPPAAGSAAPASAGLPVPAAGVAPAPLQPDPFRLASWAPPCAHCAGTGRVGGLSCGDCDGTGATLCPVCGGRGGVTLGASWLNLTWSRCRDCGGSGFFVFQFAPCPAPHPATLALLERLAAGAAP